MTKATNTNLFRISSVTVRHHQQRGCRHSFCAAIATIGNKRALHPRETALDGLGGRNGGIRYGIDKQLHCGLGPFLRE
jgi:hypothetical protein